MKYILLFTILLSNILTVYSQILKDEWVKCNKQGCELLDPYYSDDVTMEWSGDCVDGKANGHGILKKYINGDYESTFVGEFKNGIREGKGKFTHVDQTVAEGTFKNGQLIGYGSRVHEDGAKYEGEFINYRQHGIGTINLANGSKFEGFFVSDKPYTGKWTNYDGEVTYFQKYYPVNQINEKSSGYKPEIGKRVTEYFDENWSRCKQEEAAFYRLITYESENKPKGVAKDYYISGQIQSEFTAIYLDYDYEGKNFHEGEATWYHKNGEIEEKRYYYNNKVNGENTFYYDNGTVSEVINYYHGTLNGYYKRWFKTGNPSLIAYYKNGVLYENKYIEYDESGVGAIVYNENFFANKDTWESKYDNHQSYINNQGQLEFKLSDELSAIRTNYISLNQDSDYSIESIIQRKSGNDGYMYGLLFGFKDWENYYEFGITEYGSYRILGEYEGISIEIADWTKSNAINTDNKRNLLKIIKFDSEFIFSINGTIVKRTDSKQLRGNYFGLIAGGKGNYTMETLTVKEFVTAEELEAQTPKEGNDQNWNGNGSGIIISKDGYIVTNHHVIKNTSDIEVEFNYKGEIKSFKAKIVKSDIINDLAIIKIDDPNFNSLADIPYNFKTRSSDVGSSVFALGYPMALSIMGKEIKFTDGKISSKTGFQGDITTYQTTTPIQPGNSGGPLFDYNGNLIGINSSGLDKSVADNVSYSIKTSYILNLIDVLPESIPLPSNTSLSTKPLTEQVKILSDYVVLIKVK
jgi:S1-C subfamily serine protease/antitoxin component YwqK of YwqJK toxin-antitoxin module